MRTVRAVVGGGGEVEYVTTCACVEAGKDM